MQHVERMLNNHVFFEMSVAYEIVHHIKLQGLFIEAFKMAGLRLNEGI